MSFRAWRSHFLSASCVALSALIALWNVIASFVIDRGWHPAGDPALDDAQLDAVMNLDPGGMLRRKESP